MKTLIVGSTIRFWVTKPVSLGRYGSRRSKTTTRLLW